MDVQKEAAKMKAQMEESFARQTLKMLKEKYPNLSWNGEVSISVDTGMISYKGFSPEEMEIINKIKYS